MKPVSRGAIFWGAALVSGGVTVLLIQQELISPDITSQAIQWWPLILIGAGVAIIFAGALGAVATALAGVLLGALVGGLIATGPAWPAGIGCAGTDPGSTEVLDSGPFDGSPDVTINFNCGVLAVETTDQGGWEVAADGDGLDRIGVASNGGSLTVDNGTDDTGIHFGQRQRLEVALGQDDYQSLEVQVNAAESSFVLGGASFALVDLDANAGAVLVDLTGTRADAVDLTLNAGAASIIVDAATLIGTRTPGSLTIGVNAGSVELCAPNIVGLRFDVTTNVTFSHNLDDAGLTQNGDTWQTPQFQRREVQLHVVLSGNAASFTLNPDGGCS